MIYCRNRPPHLLNQLLGFLFGRVRWVSTIYMPLMMLLNALARIALGPLFLIWFGIGFNKSVALAVSIVLFIVFFNVYSGLKEVEQNLVNSARIRAQTKVA